MSDTTYYCYKLVKTVTVKESEDRPGGSYEFLTEPDLVVVPQKNHVPMIIKSRQF